MEMAGVCPVCSEMSRSLKKFEKQLSEERRWNISQREYCMQLQQEMQKDKDFWQRQENTLRENIKDLSNKTEDLFKTIQDQHKENAHLEYKNEVLEDHKQELQDKVTMLQDKVKHLCAEMTTVQYRARMLEEKLTATTKLLEESHKLKMAQVQSQVTACEICGGQSGTGLGFLGFPPPSHSTSAPSSFHVSLVPSPPVPQARISQAEGQKSRLEMKVNRFQEEKKQMQAELNHVRDENCQMQMQLIELQQNLSCLDAGPQQIQVNHVLQQKLDRLLDIGYLEDSNRACREKNDIDDCAAVNELTATKEMENKNRNTTTVKGSCTPKWQQQIAFCNGDTAAMHQVNKCTLASKEVFDNATECCDLDLHLIEDYVEENGIKGSCSNNRDHQKAMILDEEKTLYDICELGSCNARSSCGNENQMNICKEDLENIKKASHITKISENMGNMRETTIRNSIGYMFKCVDEMPISVSTANVTHVTFTDKADNLNASNLKEAPLHKNALFMNSCEDDFVNLSNTESQSFAASDNEVKWNTLHTHSHKQVEDIGNGIECTCYYEEKQTNVGTFHPGHLCHAASMSQSVECCTEISGETEENKNKYPRNFTHCTKESKNVQHFNEIISNGSVNTDIVPNSITNFGPIEKIEDNHSSNSSSHAEYLSQKHDIETRKEGNTAKAIASISDASQIDNLDSVKSLEKEAHDDVANKHFDKKTDNRVNNHLINKRNKPQNKSNQTENETKLIEVSEKGRSNSGKNSQSSSSGNNEGSSNLEKRSQRISSRNNEGSSIPEKSSERSFPRNNEGSSNSERRSQEAAPKNNEVSSNSEKSSQISFSRNNEGRSNSERSQRASPKNNEVSSNSEKSSQISFPRNNEGRSNSERRSQRASPKNNEVSPNPEKSSQVAFPRNNEGRSNSERRSQRASPKNNEVSSNPEKSSQVAFPRNNEGRSNSERRSQRASPKNNEVSSNSEKSSQSSSPRNNEGISNLEKKSQKTSLRNNEQVSNSERRPQRASPKNSEKSLQKAPLRSNGLNKNKEKLSYLNKTYQRMENIQQCKENNHSNISSEFLNNNNYNANHLIPKTSMHTCSRNIQIENETLNDNAILQCETNNEGHMSSEKTLEVMQKGTCRSNKIRGKLYASNENNITKQRNIPVSNRNIQTENGMQHILLNKTMLSLDDSSVHKQNTGHYSKDAVKDVALNKNINSIDHTMGHKMTTSLHNRDIPSDIRILSGMMNCDNNNVSDVNVIHKKISKSDKNIQTPNEVLSIALSKNKNTLDDNVVCRKNSSQCNRQPHSESIDGKLGYKKNVLQYNKDVQSENGIQSSALYKNNSYLMHKNASQSIKETPSITLCKRIGNVENDLVQKTNISQCSKSIQKQIGVQTIASSKNDVINSNLVHKRDKLQHQNMRIENTIQFTDLSKNDKITDDKVEYKSNSLQNGIVIQSIALSKHSNTTDDLPQKKNTAQADKHVCSENEIQYTSLGTKSNTIDDKKLAYKMNALQQPISSSNKNSSVSDNLEQKKDVSQSNKNIKNENGIQSNALNKNITREDDHQCRKNITQWNKNVQSKQAIHPIALNKSVIDNYFTYKRNTLKCEKYEETKNRIQPITVHEHNGFLADNDAAYTCNISQSNVYIQNQNEIKFITHNENKHSKDNDLVCKNNAPHCSKDHGSHSTELELEVLHEAENTCMMNCSTSSNEICNDIFDSNIKTTKRITQVNSLHSSEEMSLVSAVKEGKFSNVEELLSLGLSPNCIHNGNTALHAAAETANLCICRLLLEAGARADARDSFSATPLHVAARYGNLEVGKLLVEWGASISLRDKAGNLACDIAINNGHLHMYNWLQQQVCLQEQ